MIALLYCGWFHTITVWQEKHSESQQSTVYDKVHVITCITGYNNVPVITGYNRKEQGNASFRNDSKCQRMKGRDRKAQVMAVYIGNDSVWQTSIGYDRKAQIMAGNDKVWQKGQVITVYGREAQVMTGYYVQVIKGCDRNAWLLITQVLTGYDNIAVNEMVWQKSTAN